MNECMFKFYLEGKTHRTIYATNQECNKSSGIKLWVNVNKLSIHLTPNNTQ